MIDLGTVKPGSTIRIPFSTFDALGASVTMTSYTTADILIYKDGGTTARASTNGFTATTDFSSQTGRHVAVIDLADNSTAAFYAAGSEYLVNISSVTVDSSTVGMWVARFRIGYTEAVLDTTIASLSSQTSFTLTAGPAEDDALNGHRVVIHDVASAVQHGFATVLDYTGSTKTVTLAAGTSFTAAATDNISVLAPPMPVQTVTTVDGVAVSSLLRAMIAMLAGKVTVTDNGTTRTLSFKQQDGSTEAFAVTVAEADGARSATGTITA